MSNLIEGIKWEWRAHISYGGNHYGGGKTSHTLYRNEELKAQKESLNNKVSYFLDNDPREFSTEAKLLQAINERGK